MEFVYDLDRLTTNTTILIQAAVKPGASYPIAGVLAKPPILNDALNFMELDSQGFALEFRTMSLSDAGILPYEDGTTNTVFRTAVLEDRSELPSAYQKAFDDHTRSRMRTPSHLHMEMMVCHPTR